MFRRVSVKFDIRKTVLNTFKSFKFLSLVFSFNVIFKMTIQKPSLCEAEVCTIITEISKKNFVM